MVVLVRMNKEELIGNFRALCTAHFRMGQLHNTLRQEEIRKLALKMWELIRANGYDKEVDAPIWLFGDESG